MSRFSDREYLTNDQYKDATNLDARVALHKRFSTNPYGWMNWVFDHLLTLPENARILEVGCGPAHLWAENVNRVPGGWNVMLSDLSPGMLDAAWRNLVVTGRAFQFKEIDAQSVPFEDETFDAVIANHMLYHVSDRVKAIAEIERVLKYGGRFIATTVGENHMHEIMEWFRRINVDNAWESFVEPFTLENGLEQLKPYFTQVSLSRYEDSLHITEIEPLIAYIRSAIRADELSAQKLTRLRYELESELREKGKIFISKDSGLFEAIK
jgi:ubiquinone/menaquinone biosynthesis C-methylase UbiE